MLNNADLPIVSGTAATASIVSSFSGENIMAWVFLAINIATLVTNAAISIYRKIRDRDKDLEDKEEPKK